MSAVTPHARIRAIAGYVPQHRLSNEALAGEHPEWDVGRIAAKTGIDSRSIVDPGVTAGDLATAAAQKLFRALNIDGSAFDYLLFCTQSPDYFLPATACILQHRLGLPVHAGAIDFNQGCSGYIYGLQLARALVVSGAARNVLLLTGETYSRYIRQDDRTVRPLFGDGASATWVHGGDAGALIGTIQVGTDGSGAANLIVESGAARRPQRDRPTEFSGVASGCAPSGNDLSMDGRAVFNFTLERIPSLVDDILRESAIGKDDVSWLVLHQANRFMNEHLRKKLGFAEAKVPTRLADIGNTVSSTIPLVLTARGGQMKPGEMVLAIGFGVGYSWGGALLTWGAGVDLLDA